MDIGDEVILSAYPSWGVCVIIRICNDGPEPIYSVRRAESEGITLLMGLKTGDVVAHTPPAATPTDPK